MKLKIRKIPWFLSWKGLLGGKVEPILLKTRFGIHTFGLREPIDVVILDNQNKVQKLKENLLPNSFFFWNPIFDQVLELPHGSIKKFGLHLGGVLGLHLGS